ncbi:IS1595 family transposase [Dysgonomonas alginatilytica]|nr:IS1595 family transposase [Dysgonomonas alginatilytica]
MKPKSLLDLLRNLHDRKSCREFLEGLRWQGIPKCPHCNCQSEKHYKLKNRGEFNGLYKCRECKTRFTVTIGTMFEGSNVPLEKWFYAIYVFLSHKKGISSIQLSKDIGVTQKTAWFMLTKIRHNLNETDRFIANKFDSEVQIDETYVGGKPKGRIWQNQGRSLKQKTPVVGILSHDRVYTLVVPNTSGRTLKTIIYSLIKPGTTIVTDGWKGYHGISPEYVHQVVYHKKGSYKNKEGFHTNGIEGFWSHLKRGLIGIYHSVSPKYLQFYCNEFTYRYNTLNLLDGERFIQFITSIHKRLKYHDLAYA